MEGVIELESRIRVSSGRVTIDGSTAPGNGITIMNHGIHFVGDCDDIIVRHLRIRVLTGGSSGDCLLFWGTEGGTVERVLVDRCSLMWATDEVVNTWGSVKDLTFQWTIIAEGQSEADHSKGPHSMGWLSGKGSDRITIHHCLFAHNGDRSPRIQGGIYDLANALGQMQRVGKEKYMVVESYRSAKELFNLQCWALTCQSFFSPQEMQSKSRPKGKILSCISCGLYKDVRTPKMEPFGNFGKGILNVGEAPGATEDVKGMQWQGPVGQYLQRAYRRLGVNLFEDCLNTNAANCRPIDGDGGNRPPTSHEISCCGQVKIFPAVEEHKPNVIILLGAAAVQSVIGPRWKGKLGKISKWRGWIIPDRELKAWVCPVFHPSFVQRSDEEGRKVVKTIWLQDLERALSMAHVPLPVHMDEGKQVVIVEDHDELTKVLKELRDGTAPLALDFETTGLKPHAEGHKIVCMAFCNIPHRAYAFMTPEKRSHLKLLKEVLQSRIGKVAQNMKFEAAWAQQTLGYPILNWEWDTMVAAHVQDNRPGVTSLEFQVYVNFGVTSYAGDVSSYLKSKDAKDGNSMNGLDELIKTRKGRRALMLYCGLDTLHTYKLAPIQIEAFEGVRS